MESFLQRKLRNYLESTGLSVPALERKAGLKMNVARNILRGQSKKPTADTLQALANAMECEVSDLLGIKKESFTSEMKPADDGSPLMDRPQILQESLQSILKVINETESQVTLKQALQMLEEVYIYSVEIDSPQIDEHFVKWFVKRTVG